MFRMRKATAADTAAVADMIRARCSWLEHRGLPSLREDADDLAGQARHGFMWLLCTDPGNSAEPEDVVGCTTVLDRPATEGWAEAERAGDDALHLFSTVTHPEYRGLRPGAVISRWAARQAAHQGRAWLRLSCVGPELARHYRDQGFTTVREFATGDDTLFLLECRTGFAP
ncbi:hypothetical protein [Nocardiopsis salina]|uniref:hypothetical protein n=1 Tax=Nocardiopsis salina TaxID=245836 RepID=UPI0003696EE4